MKKEFTINCHYTAAYLYSVGISPTHIKRQNGKRQYVYPDNDNLNRHICNFYTNSSLLAYVKACVKLEEYINGKKI